MKTFQSGNDTITVPDISVVKSDDPITFRIEEGEWAGVMFTIAHMRFDDKEEGLLLYDLDVVKGEQPTNATPKDIEGIVSNFILSILYDQANRSKGVENGTH
jgi:hypothetical protein